MNIKLRHKLLLPAVIVLLLVCACGSTGQAFSENPVPSDKAVIYFYRPGTFSLSGRTIFMEFNDDRTVWAMRNKGYYPLVVNPGTVRAIGVGTDAKTVSFTLQAKAGEVYFIKVFFDEAGHVGTIPAKFEQVDPETGREEIRECSMISKTK